jgi:hypothetical protein
MKIKEPEEMEIKARDNLYQHLLKQEVNAKAYKYNSEYQDLDALSQEYFSAKISPRAKNTMIKILQNKGELSYGRSTLFQKEVDLTTKGFTTLKSERGTKVFPTTQTTQQTTATADLNQKIKEIVGIPSPTSQKIVQLKTAVIPKGIQQTQMSRISEIEINALAGLQYSSLTGAYLSRSRQDLKPQTQLKNMLKELLIEKEIQMEQLKTGQKTFQPTKTIQSLKSEFMKLPELSPLNPFPRNPPKYVPRNPPKLKFNIFGGDDELMKKIKEKIKKGKKYELQGLFPDFTSRAIGLAPKKVKSAKDAMKEIMKIQTGFEIRTGARIKGYSPINEKSLLRGIMK